MCVVRRRALCSCIYTHLTPPPLHIDTHRFSVIFSLFDKDNDGVVTRAEMSALLSTAYFASDAMPVSSNGDRMYRTTRLILIPHSRGACLTRAHSGTYSYLRSNTHTPRVVRHPESP